MEEEARKVARNIVKAENALASGDARAREFAEKSGLGYMRLEASISVAIRDLREVARAAEETGLADEHKEYIRSMLNTARELINVVEAKLLGGQAIDWDSELLQIAGKEI